jgi:hypothetical protein
MVGEQGPEAGIFQQRGPLRGRHGSGVWNMCKAEVRRHDEIFRWLQTPGNLQQNPGRVKKAR